MKWQSENRKWAELVSVCSTRPWVKTCLGLYSTSPTPPTPWKCTGTSEEAALWCSALHKDHEDCEEGMLAFRLAFFDKWKKCNHFRRGSWEASCIGMVCWGTTKRITSRTNYNKVLSNAFFDINVNTRTTLGSLVHIGQNYRAARSGEQQGELE